MLYKDILGTIKTVHIINLFKSSIYTVSIPVVDLDSCKFVQIAKVNSPPSSVNVGKPVRMRAVFSLTIMICISIYSLIR